MGASGPGYLHARLGGRVAKRKGTASCRLHSALVSGMRVRWALSPATSLGSLAPLGMLPGGPWGRLGRSLPPPWLAQSPALSPTRRSSLGPDLALFRSSEDAFLICCPSL